MEPKDAYGFTDEERAQLAAALTALHGAGGSADVITAMADAVMRSCKAYSDKSLGEMVEVENGIVRRLDLILEHLKEDQ